MKPPHKPPNKPSHKPRHKLSHKSSHKPPPKPPHKPPNKTREQLYNLSRKDGAKALKKIKNLQPKIDLFTLDWGKIIKNMTSNVSLSDIKKYFNDSYYDTKCYIRDDNNTTLSTSSLKNISLKNISSQAVDPSSYSYHYIEEIYYLMTAPTTETWPPPHNPDGLGLAFQQFLVNTNSKAYFTHYPATFTYSYTDGVATLLWDYYNTSNESDGECLQINLNTAQSDYTLAYKDGDRVCLGGTALNMVSLSGTVQCTGGGLKVYTRSLEIVRDNATLLGHLGEPVYTSDSVTYNYGFYNISPSITVSATIQAATFPDGTSNNNECPYFTYESGTSTIAYYPAIEYEGFNMGATNYIGYPSSANPTSLVSPTVYIGSESNPNLLNYTVYSPAYQNDLINEGMTIVYVYLYNCKQATNVLIKINSLTLIPVTQSEFSTSAAVYNAFAVGVNEDGAEWPFDSKMDANGNNLSSTLLNDLTEVIQTYTESYINIFLADIEAQAGKYHVIYNVTTFTEPLPGAFYDNGHGLFDTLYTNIKADLDGGNGQPEPGVTTDKSLHLSNMFLTLDLNDKDSYKIMNINPLLKLMGVKKILPHAENNKFLQFLSSFVLGHDMWSDIYNKIINK